MYKEWLNRMKTNLIIVDLAINNVSSGKFKKNDAKNLVISVLTNSWLYTLSVLT